VAVTDTVAGLGTEFGAVYDPLVEMVPTVALPPVVPFTAQVTLVLVVPLTVALNDRDWPTLTLALVGEIITET
jgi:hypothetical protein